MDTETQQPVQQSHPTDQQSLPDKVIHNAENKDVKSDENSVNPNQESNIQNKNPKETFKEEKYDEVKVQNVESEKANDKQSGDSISENVNKNENSHDSSTPGNHDESQSKPTE